ncbi:MAG: hypothetical protein MZV70_32295 [Desulfobacterales bacterium]|nr:hypothetical protein [Desulfobacterales bacterium]
MFALPKIIEQLVAQKRAGNHGKDHQSICLLICSTKMLMCVLKHAKGLTDIIECFFA